MVEVCLDKYYVRCFEGKGNSIKYSLVLKLLERDEKLSLKVIIKDNLRISVIGK